MSIPPVSLLTKCAEQAILSLKGVTAVTYDCLILGAGPAGMSAALQCKARARSALLVGNPPSSNLLSRAEQVDNYLGLPAQSGKDLLSAMWDHLSASRAADFVPGRALTAMDMGGTFYVSVGSEVYMAKTVILATGVSRSKPFPCEEALLGKGVSYCASCDGMLYRQKDVVVFGAASDAAEEANMLSKMGCRVTFVAPQPPTDLSPDIPFIKALKLEILGESAVSGVSVNGQTIPCQGVFLLRDSVAPSALFPSLALNGSYIAVDRAMETNLPGVFAAGDCTGLPLQIAKAVGEGQVAAMSADHYLKSQES